MVKLMEDNYTDFRIVDNPLIIRDISVLRDSATQPENFRDAGDRTFGTL
jgi:uracil phosphoribosyltransferase